MRWGLIAIAALAVAGAGVWWLIPERAAPVSGGPVDLALVEIRLPDRLSAEAEMGRRAFEAKCAVCHGINAVGQYGGGPPLVHKIYEPGHHGDESFQRAVAVGVRAHHWPFGNMPPVEGLTRGDVAMITAYVRTLQRANGIY
ncbi:MAG: cytochrome c [Pseudomonadota bacterium]